MCQPSFDLNDLHSATGEHKQRKEKDFSFLFLEICPSPHDPLNSNCTRWLAVTVGLVASLIFEEKQSFSSESQISHDLGTFFFTKQTSGKLGDLDLFKAEHVVTAFRLQTGTECRSLPCQPRRILRAHPL